MADIVKLIAVADTSSLIGLALIKKLSLLEEFFSEIYIPKAVYEEAIVEKAGVEEIKNAAFIKMREINDSVMANFLIGSLGKGEAEALVLAKEIKSDYVLIDEKKARKVARRNGFNVIGILGILLAAKRQGKIGNIKPIIDELNQKGFRLSQNVIESTLKEAKEL